MQPQRRDPVYDEDDSKPVTRANLRALEGGGETTEPKRDHLRDVSAGSHPNAPDRGSFGYNPNGDSRGSNVSEDGSTASPEALRDGETDVEQPPAKQNQNNFLQNFAERTKSRISGSKWIFGIGLGSGLFVIIAIVLLLIFLGNYKIVQLGAEIADYQLARVSRNYSESVSQITAQDAEISTADQGTLQKLSSSFANVKDGTWGAMWDKIDQYRPDKIVQNFKQEGTLDFQYEQNSSTLWRKKLTAVVVNGEEITPANASLWNKIVHPSQTRTAQIEFSDELNARLAQSMAGRGPVIRSLVAKNIQKELGVKLQWWKQGLDKYSNASEEQANALIEQEAEQTVNGDIHPAPSNLQAINDGAQNTNEAINNCATDQQCLKEEVKNGGQLPKEAVSSIESSVTSDAMQKAVAFANPVYAVGLPVCLIYDGSLANPGSGQKQSVDNVSKQDQVAFLGTESAGDQQKNGSKVNGPAAGAMDWKLGKIQDSIPGERAAGTDISTADQLHPQANGDGTLGNEASIFSFLPSPLSNVGNALAPSACSVITNIWVGAGTAIGSILTGFFTGGTSTATEDSLGTALAKYVGTVVQESLSKKELAKLGLIVGGTAALTVFAKMQVAQKAAASDNGFPVGPSWDNAADRGGNLYAQEMSRQSYGRPLTNAEVAESSVSDQNYRANELAGQSFTERYFALSNPSSLASQFGNDISAHLNSSILSSLTSLGSKVLNPAPAFASVAGGFSKQVALADSAKDDKNYGNVQWGFSDSEESLIKSDSSYRPLENAQRVAKVTYQGQPIADYITQKYSKCWSYDTSGNVDQNATMGTLLSDGSLIRNNDGDVTSGLCSPENLGVNSADPAAYDPIDGKNDMIFRYRVMKNYETVIDNLLNFQDVTADPTGPSSGSTGVTATDYQNPLRDVKSLRPERIDMGVDYAGSGPVYALGSGTITNLTNSGWDYGGYDAFISEKLDSGPAAGFYNYVAEACVPVPSLHVGQHVDSNTVICNMINPGSTGIETGWAADGGGGDTLAVSKGGGYTEGYATKAGENYNDLLVSLGAPSGTQQPQMGTLPPGLPSWK